MSPLARASVRRRRLRDVAGTDGPLSLTPPEIEGRLT
jgi:hypothetical protein